MLLAALFNALSCSSYYTKMYLVGDEPADLTAFFPTGETVMSFRGWTFNLVLAGVVKNPHREDVEKDSFDVSISARPDYPELARTNETAIENAYIILMGSGKRVNQELRLKYFAQDSYIFSYESIHIPASERTIRLQFTVRLTEKSTGESFSKEWKGTLWRYETKEKGVPAGLFH